MPTPTGSTPFTDVALSGNALIDSLVYGSKWGGALGTSAALSYSFRSSSSYYATDYSYDNEYLDSYPLSPNQKAAATKALGAWAAVANLSFSLTTDSSASTGDLRFGGYASMEPGTAAWAYLPGSEPAAGDIWIGPATSEKKPSAGSYDYLTFLHEIGHALGLKHPFESDTGNSNVLPVEYDDVRYTVMSYTDSYSFEPTTPMLLDIAAIQYLYGANMQWHTGNDSYQWGAKQRIFETIWDAGGIDTINASKQAQAVTIDLNPGSFSNIGPKFLNGSTYINNGLAIAYGTEIENAIGSAHGDTLRGNQLANLLNGGKGNDTLIGGAGNDTLVGGAGNDTYVVDSIADVISETSKRATEIDTVESPVSWTLGNNLEKLVLTGASAIDGIGNTKNNTLTGNAAANLLNGGAGNDWLIGGAGADQLYGGSGADRFVFNGLSEMGIGALRDLIGDFLGSAGDKIDLSALDADTATAANEAFSFIGSTAFNSSNAAGQLRFADSVLYGSTDTDSAAEFEIQLLGVTSLSNSDLVA